uniref:Antimicrobial peptide n=1 Tax=Euperipatoides rowelli TaxID=49087 RepID=D9IX82_EUPRO|nr:antimicrobial peptide [Euperipatoides rowelli]
MWGKIQLVLLVFTVEQIITANCGKVMDVPATPHADLPDDADDEPLKVPEKCIKQFSYCKHTSECCIPHDTDNADRRCDASKNRFHLFCYNVKAKVSCRHEGQPCRRDVHCCSNNCLKHNGVKMCGMFGFGQSEW